jgi:hypothetical protein
MFSFPIFKTSLQFVKPIVPNSKRFIGTLVKSLAWLGEFRVFPGVRIIMSKDKFSLMSGPTHCTLRLLSIPFSLANMVAMLNMCLRGELKGSMMELWFNAVHSLCLFVIYFLTLIFFYHKLS